LGIATTKGVQTLFLFINSDSSKNIGRKTYNQTYTQNDMYILNLSLIAPS